MIRHPEYNRGNVYLSGGMEHAHKLGADWRIECSSKLKEMKYYPFDICALDRAYAKIYGNIYYADTSKEDSRLITSQTKANIRKHFVYPDLRLVKKDSDAVIVKYDESARRGMGTFAECQEAFNSRQPLLVVSDEPKGQRPPGWLQAIATKVFFNFEDLYVYLLNLPYGIFIRDVYGNHSSGDQYLCSLCGSPFKKHKQHFVSRVFPLYCSECVDLVESAYEGFEDRYDFFIKHIDSERLRDTEKEALKKRLRELEEDNS